MPEKYKPTPEDIRKAEKIMTPEQKKMSEERLAKRLKEFEYEDEASHIMDEKQKEQSKERAGLLEIRKMESEDRFNKYIWDEGILPTYDNITSYDYADNLKKELKKLNKEREELQESAKNVSDFNMFDIVDRLNRNNVSTYGVETLLYDTELMRKEKNGAYKFKLEKDEKVVAIDFREEYQNRRGYTRYYITIKIEDEKGGERNLRLDLSDNYSNFLTGHGSKGGKAIELLRIKSKWEKRIKQFKELKDDLSSVGIDLEDLKIFE